MNIADGYSRMSAGRKFGVVTVQYGPGSEAGFGAIAQAFSDNSPILYLPTGHPRGTASVSPNFDADPQFSRRDEVLRGEPIRIERVPQMLQHAFSLLRNGGPGPVLLELPTNVLAEPYPGERSNTAPRLAPGRRPIRPRSESSPTCCSAPSGR